METEEIQRKVRSGRVWQLVLFPMGVVTLVVLVVWTVWISVATLSVWWGRVVGG